MSSRKSFLLRISPELWEDLEIWARDELRSVNGQIEYLLKQALQKRKAGGHSAHPAPGPGPAPAPTSSPPTSDKSEPSA